MLTNWFGYSISCQKSQTMWSENHTFNHVNKHYGMFSCHERDIFTENGNNDLI